MKIRRIVLFVLLTVISSLFIAPGLTANASERYIYRFVDSTDGFVRGETYVIARYNNQAENHLLGVDYSAGKFDGDPNKRGVKDFEVTTRYSEEYGWYFEESDIPSDCVLSSEKGLVFGNNGYFLTGDLNLHFENYGTHRWEYVENDKGAKRIVAEDNNKNEYSLFLETNSDKATWKINAGRVKTANLFKREKVVEPTLVDDYVVIDYSVPADIDVLANDKKGMTLCGFGSDIGRFTVTENKVKRTIRKNFEEYDGQLTSSDGLRKKYSDTKSLYVAHVVNNKLRLTVTNMNFTEPIVLYYEVKTPQNTYMYSSITIYPANTVYYEDKMYDDNKEGKGDFIEYSDGWEEIGTAYEALKIAPNTERHYGYNEAYSSCTSLSGGSAHVLHGDKNTTLTNSPSASFTFTGTGFEIIASCGNDTGSIVAYLYSGDTVNKGDKPIASLFVNTYHGYELVADGYYIHNWKFTDGRWKYISRTNSDTAVENREFPRDAAEGSTMQTCEERYSYIETECDDIVQCNVLRRTDLEYGTYTVVLKTMYSEIFDHSGNENGNYDVIFDAVRIYNPAGDNAEADSHYESDGEGNVRFVSLPNLLVSMNTLGLSAKSGVVFIDGIGAVSDMELYRKYGSINEIYLISGQSIGFAVDNTSDLSSVLVGARAVESGAILNVNGSGYSITSCTDMYYDITADVIGDGYVIISNRGEGKLALSTLKLTYESPVMLQSETPVFVTAQCVGNIISRVNAEYIEDNSEEAFEAASFRAVYMPVLKAGITCDVYFTTSREVVGVKLAGNAAKLRYTDSQGYKHWHSEVYFETGGVRVYPAIAIDKDGNATEAIECTLNVEPARVKIGLGGKLR